MTLNYWEFWIIEVWIIVVLLYVIMYQNPESSNLIGWKLEVGMVSLNCQQDKG